MKTRYRKHKCQPCKGTGTLWNDICKHCRGKTFVMRPEPR